jgi:hypothetical protein
MIAVQRFSTPADDQLAVQFLIELLLLVLPCRDDFVLGDVCPMRLPMADRSKPGHARGQRDRRTICGRGRRQIGENRDGILPVGCVRGRKQGGNDGNDGRCATLLL